MGDAVSAEALEERYRRHLLVMRLDVTAEAWAQGLAMLAARYSTSDAAAAQAVYELLYRLTPYWQATQGWIPVDPPPDVLLFDGWRILHAELEQDMRGLDQAERADFLLGAFGTAAQPMLTALLQP